MGSSFIQSFLCPGGSNRIVLYAFSGNFMVGRKLFLGTLYFGNRMNMWPLCWIIFFKKLCGTFNILSRCIFSNNPQGLGPQ